ncbi:MAG: peptide chain release factor 3 [Candidatus Binatia bacterium]|nr:peptide chain release factor 3 [Candidatus Binatia bacterium]MDG2009578.1 peptide chain release factor 3 [Candidatus Binatia bacterium]
MNVLENQITQEILRRRTFAIISHPDAGKTTLTEKILLFGGAVREAGAVRAQKASKHATSDWLEIEKQRGISVSSSVMHADYAGIRINILDTPGHRDFSEDTYRTLIAADSAVMLIDAAKGVEAQTRRLFEVCRMRKIPIFTFINKMDRHGQDPLDLLSEIEDVLGIESVPVNWPVGAGKEFRGTYDRLSRRLDLFSGGNHGTTTVDQQSVDGEPESEEIQKALGHLSESVMEGLELLEGAGTEFDEGRIRRGQQTPVFFGSALTNFGLKPFLDRFVELAPQPLARRAMSAEEVDPTTGGFSGFVFKIQANMDPGHRDRIAFIRICSGKFEQGVQAVHRRSGKTMRLSKSTLLMGRGREGVEEAYPGDVVGLFDPGFLQIGDTICASGDFDFPELPTFAPEHFMRVELGLVSKRKALQKGLDQLAHEGAIQIFSDPEGAGATILGAVGPLQFDVLKHRLASEYKVELRLSPLTFSVARWATGDFKPEMVGHSRLSKLVYDHVGRPVLVSQGVNFLERILAEHEGVGLAETPPMQA